MARMAWVVPPVVCDGAMEPLQVSKVGMRALLDLKP